MPKHLTTCALVREHRLDTMAKRRKRNRTLYTHQSPEFLVLNIKLYLCKILTRTATRIALDPGTRDDIGVAAISQAVR